MTNPAPPSTNTEILNDLLSSEIAVQETYQTAIRRIEQKTEGAGIALRVILWDHLQHVRWLRRSVRELGGEPARTSGAWGVWIRFLEGAFSFFQDGAALTPLKEGEQHGIRLARQALPGLSGPTKRLVKESILPSLLRHDALLDALASLH